MSLQPRAGTAGRGALAKRAGKSPPTLDLKPLRLSRRDNEFLPAAIEILETPPSPIRIWLMLIICALVAAALIWSYVGRLDIIAVAQGKLQPVGRTKIVQPVETGKVRSIKVANGTPVRAGEVLAELDASEALADEQTLRTSLLSLQAEIARRRAALAAVADQDHLAVPRIAFGPDIPPAVAVLQQRVLAADLGQLIGTVAQLRAQLAEKTVERDGYGMAVAAQQQLVATEQQRVDMRAALVQHAAASKAELIDAQETLQTQQTTLATLEEARDAAAADVEVTQRNIGKTFADFIATNGEQLAATVRDADNTAAQLARARVAVNQTVITSPIDGVVQGLSLTNPGQVVTTGEEIMQIVPAGEELEIEAYLPNEDIGFVHEGDPAIVKVAAFPFTSYGTLAARVIRVADDAIPLPDATRQEENPAAARQSVQFGGAERTQNLFFPVTLELLDKALVTDGDRMPLVAGMAVTVEIKTGTRRILDYLASPLLQVSSESLHER